MAFRHLLKPLAAAVVVATAAPAALAGGSGYPMYVPPAPMTNDFIVRVGASYIQPRSDQITFTDETFRFFDGFRTTIDPDGEWGWNLSGVWMPHEHFGFELVYINGDDHTGGDDSSGFFGFEDVEGDRFDDIGRFEADMSSAYVNWYPLDPSCMFRPYIGVGINYTDFDSESFTAFRRSDLSDLGFSGQFSLGHSWGYTWQIGADIYFGRDSAWLVNVAAAYVDSETDMRFSIFDDLAPPDERLLESYSGDYRYNPWTFNLGIGYKFSL